ncbi:MAG: hypothetical protein IH616_11365 [Gemmatimonadales bacterium]|nr:hypothetical protein [Gemmatimonadales bacterium]
MRPSNEQSPTPQDDPHRGSRRRQWTPPRVEDLPKLTDLTLITGSPIPGGGGTGGTTVF